MIAVSIVEKVKLGHETVNYDAEIKAYLFNPKFKLSKRAVQAKKQVQSRSDTIFGN